MSPRRLINPSPSSHFSISIIHLLGMLMFQGHNMVVVYTNLAMGYLLLMVLSIFLGGFII